MDAPKVVLLIDRGWEKTGEIGLVIAIVEDELFSLALFNVEILEVGLLDIAILVFLAPNLEFGDQVAIARVNSAICISCSIIGCHCKGQLEALA